VRLLRPAMSRERVVLRIGFAGLYGPSWRPSHTTDARPLCTRRCDDASTRAGPARLDGLESRYTAGVAEESATSRRTCAKGSVMDRGWGELEADELEAVPRVWREGQLKIGAMSPLRSEGTHTAGIES
jgi:hypothetical protein